MLHNIFVLSAIQTVNLFVCQAARLVSLAASRSSRTVHSSSPKSDLPTEVKSQDKQAKLSIALLTSAPRGGAVGAAGVIGTDIWTDRWSI